MEDISASGLTLILKASETYPNGIPISVFADDADPMDVPEVVIAEAAMNMNGDLVVWSSPKPILPKLALVPGSEDDIALSFLFDANRPARGKRIARDIITLVGSYPDGSTVTFSQGKMLSGMPAKSPSSAGRFKSSTYSFAFSDISLTRPR